MTKTRPVLTLAPEFKIFPGPVLNGVRRVEIVPPGTVPKTAHIMNNIDVIPAAARIADFQFFQKSKKILTHKSAVHTDNNRDIRLITTADQLYSPGDHVLGVTISHGVNTSRPEPAGYHLSMT
jgi:hypothetical protein